MFYKIIEGVYIMEDNYYNNFLVFCWENGSLLFYYNVDSKGKYYLVFGVYLKDYFGVVVFFYCDFLFWLSLGNLDMNDVFGGMVCYWEFYNFCDKIIYDLLMLFFFRIKVVCVEKDF